MIEIDVRLNTDSQIPKYFSACLYTLFCCKLITFLLPPKGALILRRQVRTKKLKVLTKKKTWTSEKRRPSNENARASPDYNSECSKQNFNELLI